MPSSFVVRRKRLSPLPGFDSVAAHAPDAGDDGAGGRSQGQGLEVFKRLPPLRDVICCAAVCRHWRRLVAGVQAASLPVAPFMPVTTVVLGAGPFPSAAPACGVVLADFRGQRLLPWELGPLCNRELRLLVSPLDKHVWVLAGDAVVRGSSRGRTCGGVRRRR